MTEFTPTKEQQDIVDATKGTDDNLLVSALAGAFKTSTLVLIARAKSTVPILSLAFNKKIATEMAERLPGNCESKTFNGLGHGVWMDFLGKRVRLDDGKVYRLLKAAVEALPKKEKAAAYEDFTTTMKAIKDGKTYGYIPDGHFRDAKPLMNDAEFFASLDEEPSALQERLIREVTNASIAEGMRGVIDFNDQILLPGVFPVSFPKYPLVLVDESQDLSELNHVALYKLFKRRIIAVGDECQGIYAFRGADSESMARLQQMFSMRRMILSISGRCPVTIVKEAQWRAPHMKWLEGAKLGTVENKNQWSVEDIPDTATIICRNNAPLFGMAIKLLKNGRYPELVGNDIGKNLTKVMAKFGDHHMPQAEVLSHISLWQTEKLAKSRTPSKILDQADCMVIFAEQGKDLGEALAYADYIMSVKGPVQMMTGHKSKGLEFDTVFILDRDLVRVKEGQEANLLYVMQTRSKDKLTYVTSEGFVENMPTKPAGKSADMAVGSDPTSIPATA